jgi:hypothetical protein
MRYTRLRAIDSLKANNHSLIESATRDFRERLDTLLEQMTQGQIDQVNLLLQELKK